jgi:tetratricopeptide (TPR) repeat protein
MLRYFIVLCFGLFAWSAMAQKPIAYYDPTIYYREGLELFHHDKFVAAKEKFEQYIAAESNAQHTLRINAEYYNGICSLYLLHKDAEYQLEKFVQEHPDSPWKGHVYFELATFNYKKRNYKKTLEWFEFVDPKSLTTDERTAFYYKRGHSRLEQGDVANARQDLYEAKQVEGEYQLAAIYYYSHIAYEQNDLQTALEGFQRLENDPNFKPLMPFYITQIYYKQKKYDEVLQYGPKALAEANNSATKRVPEIARLIGDAHCVKEQYAQAIPFLQQYHAAKNPSDLTADDFYQLGYAYHRTSAWQKAIDAYNNCKKEDNELAQKAAYNIGECYLKLNQKEYARNGFAEASKMAFNLDLQEDALFNYAKLAFELSYNPFHEAITAFEDYLTKYPNSKRRDEANEFLLNVYMKTRNYDRALASLNKIQNKDNRVKEAYQVVAFNRGVELFQSEKYPEADQMFDKVFTYTVNPSLTAEAKFWKAEVSYRRKEWTAAISRYNAFINEPGAFNTEVYGLAHYGMGYAYFEMANGEDNYPVAREQYAMANTSFRKYVDGNHSKESAKVNDANMRIGDCFFVNENFAQAIAYYDKAADKDENGKDYAMFQKAMSYGYDGKNDKKAWVLKSLISERPDSKFEIEAKYELARTYLAQERLNEARTYYNDILKNHASSSYVKFALRDLCLVNIKEGDNAAAKANWTALKTGYPNDPVLRDAYQICRLALIEDPEFQADAIAIGGASKDEVETSVYLNAVSPAQNGDCNTAIQKLTDYLKKFNAYALEAHWYLANCYYDKDENDKALDSYNYVIAQGASNYLEISLVNAATINYNKKNYAQAAEHYAELESTALSKNNQLEAQVGLLRCNYFLERYEQAKLYANLVLQNPSSPQDIKFTAQLWKSRMDMNTGAYDEAMTGFKEVMKKGGEYAAEAKYSIANCLYKKGEFKKAETEVFQLFEKYSAWQDFQFKGYLLLIDIYIGMPDLVQADATVELVLQNVEEPWVVEATLQRKQQIEAIRNPSSAPKSNQEIEIDLVPNNNN